MNQKIVTENNGLIRDYFRMANEMIDESPSEDECQALLEGAFKLAKIIAGDADSVSAHNFDGRWDTFKRRIGLYADPSTLQFYSIEVEKSLNEYLG